MDRHTLVTNSRLASCEIFVARGALGQMESLLASFGHHDSVHLLHDEVLTAQAVELAALLGGAERLPIPGGESVKRLSFVESLAQQLLQTGATRHSLLLVLGGGTLSDLGAFLASIYMRGIDCVLIPSTLLAMCDAAIGGKNGVDLQEFKNILGVIRQPVGVVIDPDLVESLANDAIRDGLVEAVKKAMILDEDSFEWFESEATLLGARAPSAIDEAIHRAVKMKVQVVMADERESGQRLFLNFGHTVAHAIEKLTDFGYSHGRAVACGMPVELRMARAFGEDRLLRLFASLGIDATFPQEISAEDLWRAMQADKKKSGGKIRVAVPKCLGQGRVTEITLEDLQRVLS